MTTMTTKESIETSTPKSPKASELKKFMRVFHGRGPFFYTYIRFDVNSLDKFMTALETSEINKDIPSSFHRHKLWRGERYGFCELDWLYCIHSESSGLMMIRRKCGDQKWNICWRDVTCDEYNPPKIDAIQTLLDVLVESGIDFELAKTEWQYIDPIPMSLAQPMIDTDLSSKTPVGIRKFDSFTILEAQDVELSWHNDRMEKEKMSEETLT